MSVRSQKEMPSTLKGAGELAGKNIIEYGCGTGRYTIELASRCENILAIDFSKESLLIIQNKIIDQKNVGLVLADIVPFKTKDDFFDIAFSAQVYEHIPSVEQRMSHLENVKQTLKPGGMVLFTAYHQDLRRKINKLPQEGRHPNGIFYHYFTAQELCGEFSEYFTIQKIQPIDISLPLESRMNLPGNAKGLIARMAEKLPLIRNFGHLILIKAQK